MSASTNMISDAKSIYNTAPTAATVILATRAQGPIMDYSGNAKLGQRKAEEASNALLRLLQVTDGSDGIKTTLTAIQHELLGLSAPSGTVITDIKTCITTGPSATTTTNAIAAAGPIIDFLGMLKQVLLYFQELFVLYTQMKTDTDASDPNLTTINSILTALT